MAYWGLAWRQSSRAGVTSQAQRGEDSEQELMNEAHGALEWTVPHVALLGFVQQSQPAL